MKTILVIEDDSQTRENLAIILEMEGYHVVQGVDGAEGVDLARRENPDLILFLLCYAFFGIFR